MKKVKILIAFTLLFIVVGIATVTTNLVINGTTSIASNQDDFLVYFSDVLVDGVQDLSLVRNEKELVFNSEFSAVGDKVTIDYDVTNASKNYDAEVSISCIGGNNYLSVVNNFEQISNLLARSTRRGTLTVELINAVSIEQVYEVKCTITGTAVERETQGSGTTPSPMEDPYKIGTIIEIGEEKFNVISSTTNTVTLFAQKGLTSEYKQGDNSAYVKFSNTNGWEYTPGPKEIDIQQYDGPVKTYLNEYKTYLKTLTGDETLTTDLISVKELKQLGCSIETDDYSPTDGDTCITSPYESWIVLNSETFWTKSPWNKENFWGNVGGERTIWIVTGRDYTYAPGTLYYSPFWGGVAEFNGISYNEGDFEYTSQSVRPVVTISKETLEKTIIKFSIDETEYKAEEGMTWEEWVNSPFNTGGYEIIDNMLSINYGDEDYDHIEVVYNYDSFENAMGTDIIVQNASYVESSHQPD